MASRSDRTRRRRKVEENQEPEEPRRKLRSRTQNKTSADNLKSVENKRLYNNQDTVDEKEDKSQSCSVTQEEDERRKMESDGTTGICRYTPEKDDLFSQILHGRKPRRCSGVSRLVFPYGDRSTHITGCLNRVSLGNRFVSTHRQTLSTPVARMVGDMVLCKKERPFDRRCTALEWHPNNPNIVAAGSKSGDIILRDIHSDKICDTFINGTGPGGSIQAMKFMPNNDKKLLTASVDGTVCIHDLDKSIKMNVTDTFNVEYWFCGIDVRRGDNTIVIGDNTGSVQIWSPDGQKIFGSRLHKQKVTHVEYSPREEWLLCTASTDQTVQLWDVRMVTDRKSSLSVLKHDKPVNSAYFSLRDGTRLLTTDQHHEIRIYQSGSWTHERTIEQPHRFFQHLTPIKAYWHPLEDLIVVGRYPDEKISCSGADDRRAIDLYSGDTGVRLCQLYDPGAKGIVSLCKFNNQGDVLAAGMGHEILLWQRKEEAEKIQEEFMAKVKASREQSAQGRGVPGQGQGSAGPGGARASKQRKPADREKQPEMKVRTKVQTKQSNKK